MKIGGGFATGYNRPSYQDEAVNQYFKQGNVPPSSYFNSSGRGKLIIYFEQAYNIN